MNTLILGVLMALAASLAWADTLVGRVVAVLDGDTVTVLDLARVEHRIRLSGIDAPEKAQPFGVASKRQLSEAVYNQKVTVEWTKHDRYGRIVGKIVMNGRDICLEQVKAGMAWHYKKYEREQSPEDRAAYANAEADAKARSVGLWSEAGGVPPWAWRHR
jgi:endonuclease YncB( thermonuclease family)